ARMWVWRVWARRWVGGGSAPFHWTVELGRKLAPGTIKVNAGPPAGAAAGLIRSSDGTGLSRGPTIVKFATFEVPPPGAGLTTVTGTRTGYGPATLTSAALMSAFSR